MNKTLFILNDPPYDSDRSYNALRLAGVLTKREGQDIKLFLIGGAASCARANQKLPQGHYNIEIMLHGVIRRHAEVGVCETCMEARGIADHDLVEGAKRSTLEQLTDWTVWADKVLVF